MKVYLRHRPAGWAALATISNAIVAIGDVLAGPMEYGALKRECEVCGWVITGED